jgi:autotransporter family porin
VKKLIILTTVLFFAVLMAASVSATTTSPSNVYVSPTGDDANDGLTPETAVQTINMGIDRVAENGQVNLATGTYNKTGETSKDVNITITKSLTIAGAGKDKTIIDGLNNLQIFDISNDATVLIKDITFQNGKLDNSGGAISNDGTLTVQNCIFKDNTAVEECGGALFTHTTLNVVDCIFVGNTAERGSAIFNKGGSITVTGSTFIANHAGTDLKKDIGGGAIFNYPDSSFKIVGNTFLNNVNGAIYISSKEQDEYNEAGELIALINFNRIVGNTGYGIYLENAQNLKKTAASEIQAPNRVVDATNNWWGSNSNPKNNPANIGGDVDHVLADPWLILTISSKPSTIPYGSTAHVFAAITQNSNGEDTSSMGHIPDGTPITITTDIGNVGSKSVTKYTVSGIAIAILRADDGFGIAHLYAILDGFKTPVPSQVMITQAATIESKTSDNHESNTIGLQETGMPLAGLVMAILMVLGGFVVPKKK